MCQRTDILLRGCKKGHRGQVFVKYASKRNVDIPCDLPDSRCGIYKIYIYYDNKYCGKEDCFLFGACREIIKRVNDVEIKYGTTAHKIDFVDQIYAGHKFKDIPFMTRGGIRWKRTDELLDEKDPFCTNTN